jgi:hypothetical protein
LSVFKTVRLILYKIRMENENEKKMNSFVEKLCDHLSMDRVKHFIDNGFDDWETITFMKSEELVDLGYGS